MKRDGIDLINELYYGNLQPGNQGFRRGGEYDRLLTSLCDHEEWLSNHLEAEAKEHFSELIEKHLDLISLVSRENFHHGFCLGVVLLEDVYDGLKSSLETSGARE